MNFAIIAAGEGSRLAQEGVEKPKPLVEIDGRPMIGRLLEIFSQAGGRRIVVCVNEFMPEVKAYLDTYRFEPRPDGSVPELLIKVKTTPSSMHTMAEIATVMRGHGRWIATTVDTIFRPSEFRAYVDAWEQAPGNVDVMMAVTDFVDDEKPLWITTAPGPTSGSLRITSFLDRAPENPEYISGGIYGLSDPAIDVLEECLGKGLSRMRNYQRALVEKGLDVEAFPMGKIIDVDHAADIEVANRFLNS
ncbi:MAG: NTP transferase domain-containing protein [Muribaculaceae bacterium]|nr:NTP transferase domain-containing protein [Muribaculaceae bacterium]